eukprot:CFRG2106T1
MLSLKNVGRTLELVVKQIAQYRPGLRTFYDASKTHSGARKNQSSAINDSLIDIDDQKKNTQWQKWINYESPYHSQSDELNRARHFFWHIDGKGRLLRRELSQPPVDEGDVTGDGKSPVSHFGILTHSNTVDRFFDNLRRNVTGRYRPPYKYVSHMGHERYFATCNLAPIVFKNLSQEYKETRPQFEESPWSLTYASTLQIDFDRTKLRMSPNGFLYHPVVNKAIQRAKEKGEEGQDPLWGVFASDIAQIVLDHCTYDEDGVRMRLQWPDGGSTTILEAMTEEDLARL